MSLKQTIKDINRLSEIVEVLFEHELSFLIHKLDLRSYLHISKRIIPKKEIPEKYTKEFSKLQDEVKPFSFEEVKKIIESEFNKDINSIFSKFAKEPIAAASVGQVHRAILVDGREVAVKVQRPNIEILFQTDINLLYHLASLSEKHYPELRQYNLMEIVKEFEEYTKRELNYLLEARNIETFYKNFRNDPNIKVPKPYLDYTTKRVLTLEYLDGKRIQETKINKKKLAKIISDCFIKQVLDYGFFHADMHPGNIFIMPNGKIALIDYGIVGVLDDSLREKIENLFVSLIRADKESLAKSFINLSIVDNNINIESLKQDFSVHLGPYYNLSLNQIDIGAALNDILSLSKKYKMKLPNNFVLLVKAIATIEGFCKELDPNYNFVKSSKPYINKIIAKRTSPDYILSNLKLNLLNFKDFIQNFPRDFRRFIASKEKVKVDLEDEDIKRLTLPVNLALNKLSLGIVTTGLVIAASLIISTRLEPLILNIPLLSLVLYFIALILALKLLKRGEK